MGKLINRIPGSRLLISSLPGSALRTHVESLGKPRDVNKRSQSLACNLISKDTHLVFSIYLCSFEAVIEMWKTTFKVILTIIQRYVPYHTLRVSFIL